MIIELLATIQYLRVFDMAGRQIMELPDITAGQVTLDLRHLAPGSYMLQAQTPVRREEHKLIKF